MRDAADNASFLNSIARVRRMFSLGLGVMAFLWLIVIPTVELWQRYSQTRLEAEIRLALIADRISSFVAANLDIWEFEGVRLPSVVSGVMRGGTNPPSRLAFIDAAGSVLEFPVRGEAETLSLHLEDSVTDGRRVIGRVVMDIPLGDALRPALISGMIGAASVGLLLLLARLIGRNALDRSLAVIGDTASRLAHRVDELEEARQQLAERSASLQMANQDITHVALLTTHHLREPLRTILSYSQLLVRWHDDGGSREKADTYLGFLKSGVTRMQDQLKALSRYLGLRERTMSPGPVGLDQPLGRALSQVRGIRCDHGQLPMILGEEDLLAELFSDVLTHVLRYRRPDIDPEVTVSALSRGMYWDIRLSDNGVPLAERDPERLFHLLVHGQDGAMIMGLAQARLLAFLMGGEIRIEPRADQDVGVCFHISLPAAPQAAAGTVGTETASSGD
ncbi:MAG: HAMP domain-containing histidine kinase [Magnetospirillum sp.]|nr:HAMP domain-containing histidine kinase [Magnetospirillum sp.]